jgi:hypothetical protein
VGERAENWRYVNATRPLYFLVSLCSGDRAAPTEIPMAQVINLNVRAHPVNLLDGEVQHSHQIVEQKRRHGPPSRRPAPQLQVPQVACPRFEPAEGSANTCRRNLRWQSRVPTEFSGPIRYACSSRIRRQAATGSWTRSRQWETQRTLFSSARATVCPSAKVNGVWPSNDAWLRAAL